MATEAILYPDENVYKIRGTWWRVVIDGVKRYRNPDSFRGWTKPEALAFAAQHADVVRVDRRTIQQRRRDWLSESKKSKPSRDSRGELVLPRELARYRTP